MIEEMRISKRELELIQAELEANKPYEACGVLVGTLKGTYANIEKTLPVTNVLRTRRSFELDPGQFYNAWDEARKRGMDIIGIYHTHPVSSSVPSLWDRETMENDPVVWLIAGADGIRAYVWDSGIKSVTVREVS